MISMNKNKNSKFLIQNQFDNKIQFLV